MEKVGVLLDSDLSVSEWQYKCILKLINKKIIFFVSKEDNSKRNNYFKHFIYYLINIVSIRQKKKKIDFSNFDNYSIKKITIETDSKNWQVINNKSINNILQENPRFIYKCGLKLLKISDQLKGIPILSHHHGDPSKFRGRPAGFYEILKGERKLGQIVQVLSNKLDAGDIISYAETSIYNWSYKKTLQDAYKVTPLVFENALKNLNKGVNINKTTNGINYKLPTNHLGIYNLFVRVLYGMFYEKSWNVGYSNKFNIKNINSPKEIFNFIESVSTDFTALSISDKYKFYADPFIINSNIILEGLNKKTKKGELLLIDLEANSIKEKFKYKNKHLSYPYTNKLSDQTFIYPDSGALKDALVLKTHKDIFLKTYYAKSFKRGLVDPSFLEYNGLFYLFANYPNEKCVLRLWVSTDPFFNTVDEHPNSPVCISPFGGRSGGRVFKFGEKIYRFGQDFTEDYGNGLILFEINSLSRSNFYETAISSFKFKTFKGPHNIDFSSNLITWDYYNEKFNLLAGIDRVINIF